MNNTDHHKVVELAIYALPASSRAFWQPLASRITATCMLPDQIAIPLLNGEDGPWRHYFPPEAPKHSFEKIGASARSHFFDMRHPLANVLELMGAGDLEEACRFLGVFSHHLGDFSEPAHFYESDITLLVPPPPDRLNCNPHRMIEDTVSGITRIDYSPRVLGESLDSIVMRLEGRFREVYETAIAAIVPILQALYRRDGKEAGERLDVVIGQTAAIMADVLHTLWCLHTDGWTEQERRDLAVCRLDHLEPAAYDVEFNYGCRPLRGAITLDQIGRAMPFQLRLDPAAPAVVTPVEGLCVIPHALPIRGTRYEAVLEFDLPPGSFDRFTCQAGLLAGIVPQARCRFVVEGDGHRLFESPERVEADPALSLRIDISNRRRLRLVVLTDGSTDKLAMPIWGWPTLENMKTRNKTESK
jgi:hypothetical protein